MSHPPSFAVHDSRPISRLQTDVLIIGGGAAGVAAAVTAAQQGCKVTLIERYGFCGGGAVAGLSGTVCGLYKASDGEHPPEKIVHGFVDRFITLMEQKGGLSDAVKYGKTYTRVHDPLVWREVADALLQNAGVQVIYHATVTDVLLDGESVGGAIADTTQGKVHIEATITVDASGDASVTAMAGFETTIGDNGKVQNPTMIFRLQGVDVPRFLAHYGHDTIMPPEVSELITAHNGHGYTLPRNKIWLFPTTRPGELLANCTRITGANGRELNSIFYEDFTEAESEGRCQAREYARFFHDKLVGCETSWINDTGVQVGIRQSRQIKGITTLLNTDIVRGAKFSNGIARSPWPIELHAGNKPKLEWLLDDYYEVPFGCFVPENSQALLIAGRCLSAEHEAVASARVTAQCFSYGHAIGHAAALTVNEHVSTQKITGEDIRLLLNRDGAQLD